MRIGREAPSIEPRVSEGEPIHKQPAQSPAGCPGGRARMVQAKVAVPFFDWKALYLERADAFGQILTETAASGGFILQEAVDAFESGLAHYIGVRHAIGLSDC